MYFISTREIIILNDFSNILFTCTTNILSCKNNRICIRNTRFIIHTLHININLRKKDTFLGVFLIYHEPPPPPPPPRPDEPPPLNPLPPLEPEERLIPPFSTEGIVAFSRAVVKLENE